MILACITIGETLKLYIMLVFFDPNQAKEFIMVSRNYSTFLICWTRHNMEQVLYLIEVPLKIYI